jgi:PAS domain S-box-containing protein
MQSRAFSGLLVIGLLTLVYFIAGKFGLMLASLHASASPVWPAAGIALAALLVLGYRAWPAIIVGAFLVNVTTAGNVATSLAIASGNTLEAVCGAWLVNRFAGGTTAFDRPQGVVKFALAAVVSTIISPVFGVTSLALGGFADWANFGAIWLTWWLGDTTGDLLIAPLIILWSIPSKWRWNRRDAVEVGILLLLLFVLSEAVFCGWLTISARNYPIAFISLPIVIWMAFRFTQRETATGVFILSAIAIWGTMHGFGPFVGETENQSLLGLQSWTAVLTITAMALSAGMAERGRAEEALRESEANMSLAANAANLGLWVWNVPGGDERWVTEKWRQLFGFADSEPVTFDRFLEVVHPGDSERVKQVVQHMLEHGGEYEIDYRITRPDGSIGWIASHGSVELEERGKPVLVRGVSRDVTKRKVAEEELRESEARFRTVADAAPVMIWMSSPDKLCTFFNKGWLEFTGRAIDQELGSGWAEGVHANDLDQCLEVYGTSFDARQPFTMEYRLRRNDGEYRWVLDSGIPRFGSDGTFLGYIGSCFDITERRQSELDHQLQNMELARVGRVALMGELAASLAHEVNNPIGAMVTNANAGQRMIAGGNVENEELSDLLADIVADGHRAREVIEGIRNMVRKEKTTRALVRVDEIIRDLLRIVKADALTRKVALTTEIDSKAGSVMADRVQLLQVLLNLTLNAFEAMSVIRSNARHLVIRADRNGEGEVLLRVRDSGPGFPSGIVDQLFEPFFSTKVGGTGMGLAIARSIIEAHGGTLSGENCDDGGACFTVRLPEAKEDKSKTVYPVHGGPAERKERTEITGKAPTVP